MEKEKLHEIAFEIISRVGEARSIVLKAMDDLSKKVIDKEIFEGELKQASAIVTDAGTKHLILVQNESQGINIPNSILITHAEDLYLTTSTMIEMISKMINLFELKQ